jgi:hypothetical protein
LVVAVQAGAVEEEAVAEVPLLLVLVAEELAVLEDHAPV